MLSTTCFRFIVRRNIPTIVLTTLLGLQPPAAAQSASPQSNPDMFENLSLFVGLDGSKQPQDLGINANMGIRFAANWGFPLSERLKIGAQVGAASNISDAAVHVLDQIDGPSHRTQTFLTVGVFQRPSPRWNWGLVYDVSFERYYDNFRFGQWRGQAGYGVTDSNEVGVWFAKAVQGDSGRMGSSPVRLDPITQVNGYFRRTWVNAAQTAVWVGMADAHHNVVWVFPDNSRDTHVLVYGAEISIPLSDRFAITGATNLITPPATGTVDAYLGVTFYPRRSGLRTARNTFAPLASISNNPTMAIDLQR
jgi:Family of unknown function (DUF6666)